MESRPIQDLLTELGLDTPVCRSVLLVDDEFEVLAVLEALLDEDWDVHTAQSGDAALEILNSEIVIDLVITDQRMPGMTGVELLQSVADSHPDLYRMVLTAYSDVDPIVAAINQGKVDQFILKPWDPSALRRMVSEGLAVCERRAAMRTAVGNLSQRHEEQSAVLNTLKTSQSASRARDWIGVLDTLGSVVADALEHLLKPAETALGTLSDESPARLAIRRAQTLSDDLRRLAEANEPKRSVAPRKLISDAVRLLMEEDGAQHNPIHVDIDPSIEGLHVSIEPMRMAILSMLRNAVRASEDSVAINLRVRRGSTQHLAIEVADQGIGMSADVTQQAAEPFFSQFEPASIGLGLSLCSLVSELHGGRLAFLDNAPTGVITQLWLLDGDA